MPTLDEIESINRQVAEQLRAGDAIRTEPVWFDQARIGLSDGAFLVGYEPDSWDRHRFERLWLLVAGGGREAALDRWAHWFSEAPTTRVASPRYDVLVGPVDDPEGVAWDALDEVASASISQRDAEGALHACTTRRDGRVYCGRPNPWVFVGPVVREMDDTYRYCVSATVPDEGRTWVIEWDEVPRSPWLRLRAGNSQWAARMPRGAPVRMRVFVDDEPWVDHVWDVDEVAYPEFRTELPRSEHPHVRVRVEAHAESHHDRFFCFRLQALASPEPAAP